MKLKCFSYFIVLYTLCVFSQGAQAQIPSTSSKVGLNKKILGTWTLKDIDVVGGSSPTQEELAEIAEAKKDIDASKATVIGKMSMTFNKDGTYTTLDNTEEENTAEKGTWKVQKELLVLQDAEGTEYVEGFLRNNTLIIKLSQAGVTLMMKFEKYK